MSQFLTDLKITLLRGQFREGRQLFRLDAPLVYQSDLVGLVVVPAGFVSDMASVPKLPLAWLMAGGTANEAAVVHDFLYTTHAAGGRLITRAEADQVMREAIPASQDPNAPGWLMWLAVRVGGSWSWDAPGPIQTPAVAEVIEEAAREAA